MRRFTVQALVLTLLMAWFGRAMAAPPAQPPVAPVRPVVDDYFGTKVTDPYRWMENTKDPEFVTWLKGQATYSRSVLDAVPGRQKLLARISSLDNAGESVGDVQIAGGRVFYIRPFRASTPASFLCA